MNQPTPLPMSSTTARIAGSSLLLMALLAFFAEFFVRSRLIVAENATLTLQNLLASPQLFRGSIAADLLIVVLDIVVAVCLYLLLKPTHAGLSLLAAAFRLVYAAMYGVVALNHVMVLLVLNGNFAPEQAQSLMLLFLQGYKYGWVLALVFFGMHLLLVGHLVYRSRSMPRLLGGLLFLAGLAYLIDGFAHLLLPSYEQYKTFFLMLVALPGMVSELSLALWLIFKGMRPARPLVTQTA
ncbi:DUF4386 domain-containing protein [Deinococcus roseus]|uniref:DUF4386 domain-containing protein n=1 Tax=Deinococcus roseus TaxID=392414 RepID=A0ABQ2D4E1_9DEIO|nr:DUF4386 domain-containing protein [Deinococcus roseus]GGJ42767.1 DUF4386 domain-containing protein [Deinococcus roseus]